MTAIIKPMATLVKILFAFPTLSVLPPAVTIRNPAQANIMAAIGRARSKRMN